MRYHLPTRSDLNRAHVMTGWQLCKQLAAAVVIGAGMGLGAFVVLLPSCGG